MYARVPDGVSGYLLVQRDTGHQKTRKGFRNFFIRLVECSYSANVLLDDTLFPTLLKWLLAMSESKARCFRHTSTFVLLCIVDALSGVVGALNSRLYSQRGDKKRAATQQRCIQAMVDMRQNIVSHAVHQRARDVAPEIRLMVFTNLAQWILNYDDDFAENKYFRYFGMALSDKRPEIRTEALMMIHTTLSKTPDSGGRMFLFLQYFAKRLVEMCRDVHMRCAELAIGAIRLMLTVYGATAEEKGLLDNEMVDRSLWSLFDDRPTIRQEAGALLLAFIESRLPTEETTEEGRWTEAVQLLHSFASSLRSQCGESMPEKYLVDAIFTSASPEPPQLLQHYKSILPLVVSDEVSDSIVGISFCAALLEKLRGRLDLGPVPREDRRQTTSRKVAQAKQDALNDLASSLSLDVGVMLADAIEKHRGDIRVLASVASVIVAMDLKVFGSLGHTSKIKSLITLFRKATASLSHCEEAHMRQIASAWYTLVSEDHPHQKEAVGQLQELRRNVVKQLISLRSGASRSESREGEEFLHVWTRVNILSSLVSLLDQWDLLKSAITDHCRATTSAELLRLMVVSCSHCVLWKLQAAKEVNGDEFTSIEVVTSYGDVGQFVGELVAIIFKVWSVEPAEGGEQHFSLLTDCLISLCDFCALPYYTLSQIEQDTLVTKFADVSRKLGSAAREMREELRKAEVQFEKEGVYAAVTEHHRRLNRLEATQMRVTVGVVRLFLLNRIAGSNAPMILLQWMYAPSRAVSDVFRHLFRALRDRSEDSFSLEQSILVAAYHHSSEALCQMGQRLSSMHWPMPDKYYSACVGVVRFGIQFATTTDPAILQGISAYCPKLLKSDALAMVQVLANDERLTKSVDGSVKMFISALLRSAKIEGGPRESALKSRKRPRDTSTTVDVNGSETVVLSEQHSPSQSASIESSSQLPNRLLVADGWRVRPVDRETVERQAKRHSCAASAVISGVEGVNGAAQDEYQFSSFTQQTATQNTFASSQPDELDMSEVLIATRDYE
ncbi:cohesin complex subunit SA-1/2 [Trypanosoma vivax]|nr:cohesin complex subunit SA-1/2 [Trypanosoma vivax]